MWTHLPGWDCQAFNGIIALVMGGLTLAEWPVSGLWVIGLFVGIDLIFFGWSWVALALGPGSQTVQKMDLHLVDVPVVRADAAKVSAR